MIDAHTTEDLFNRAETRRNSHYQFFTNEEAEAMTAFLLTLKHPDAPDWGAPPLGKSKAKVRKAENGKSARKSGDNKLAKN